MIISRDFSLLADLEERLTLRNACDLYEVIVVNNHNERALLAQERKHHGNSR